MWRLKKNRGKIWMIQTTSQKVIRRLQKRKNARLSGYSPNSKLKIFKLKFSSENIAIKNLRKLTGQRIIFDALNEVFTTELPINLDTSVRKVVK